ncbi:P-loop containing nucleoside triphosphate hydrolase protein [Rhizophagus irregularis DAOM 181602=DAOM 197198]|uniref:P-loop containing nucleoside triphosphate hydrolase protein n=1 Tax=Rhizophagus irregularis (strain DAOM 181602 / DAOM 197198 / MUCL 43194) TaxID=747089 RepID=A0A2P4QLQ4_RHIID|nr:P-loop containing nucleoside triphosphate hydrolase protein [Rhizophagus irregularis DAOM 181602=DAOM 197198]POG78577.1 P-loop containing nucleoside triphosphate hydrolase protein [Rhizophagus irregularis DAOM 181602=DAOM 197198]|eukprot:XP_025185443.1 P-loop containing nucleoside triphosphate hydrolase protein [Rhizophagus irregularis DAOM 181602=DAOM 197198]
MTLDDPINEFLYFDNILFYTKFEGSDDINDLSVQLERSAKRAELIQSTEKGSTSAKNPVYVEWHGVNYSISEEHKSSWWNKTDSKLESGKHVRNIIENIHGCANPGEVLAIMGPSGCGKTTLLNLLGDRVGSKGVQGTIALNGHKMTKKSKRFIAYCTQDDIFFPHLTVKETLSYTARLRLPRELSRREKLKQVENTMALLNLTKCADTIIGDQRIRGVSGGERKRANIASELLTDPSVILLDEPTSGLDSSLALELTKILKEFAVKQRKTIIMVIHQPSSQVFESFDKLMLMADGHMVYFGERAGVVDYLADQGYKCHPNFNPADYILELLNDNTIKQNLINAYAHDVRDDPTGKQVVEKHSRRTRTDNQLSNTILDAPVTSERRWEATFLQQVSILTERTFKQSRKIMLSKVNIFQTIALTIVCLLVWLQIPFSEVNINDRVGNIFFCGVFWAFNAMIGSVSSFPLDLVMLSKERQSRSYRLLSYYLSKQIAELPLIIFNPTLYTIPVYWATNLLPDFGRFVAYLIVILLTTLTSQSFGYLFGATVLNVHKSISVSLVFILASMLLGGFYIKHLPFGLTWLKYLSFVKYSYSLLLQIQFDSPKAQFRCARPGELPAGELSICDTGDDAPLTSISGISIIDSEGLNDLPWYVNLIILLGFCIVARVLAYYSLRRNSRRSKE